MIDIATIRASTDLVALIQQRVKLTKRGKDWYGQCPFHAEKSASFSVVPAKRFYHCHGCGAHGDALDFVMQIEGLSLPDAAARLGGARISAKDRRRLETEERERRHLAALAERQEYEAALIDWEQSHWMIDWGTWLADMGIIPPVFQ